MAIRAVSDLEIDKAIEIFCDVADTEPQLFRGHARRLKAIRLETLKTRPVRRKLAQRLVRRYCLDTPTPVGGLIDWDKFRQWLKDHMAEIEFLRLILTILSLLILI